MENTANSPLIVSRASPTPYRLGHGPLSPLTFWLVCCGGIGALLFTAVYLIEGATRPGFNAWQQPISALSLGPAVGHSKSISSSTAPCSCSRLSVGIGS